MNNCPAYKSYQIKVSFVEGQVICDPNPRDIPQDVIATITWYPVGSSNFTFLQFEWTNKNGFLSQDPIIHPKCVIAAVNNTGSNGAHKRRTDGAWPYILKIQVGDRVYQSGKDTVEDGKPIINNQ
ncbi:MAG: hypothetical protein ACREP2_15095 [Rhodanobacteraceae bacterium]